MVVLKELIFNSCLFGVGCAGLETTDFSKFLFGGGCGGLDSTDF